MSDNSAHYGYYGGVTATYGYRPNSDQIATTTITSSTGTELLTHSRTYEGPDRLKSVVASRNGAVVEGYMWGYDGAGRRKTATISGGERSGDWWDYNYNDRGEVIAGVRRNAAGQVLPGYEFGYSFDAIGNRIESWREAAGPRSSYNANALNQYESRTVPGEVRVEGQAEPGSALVRLQVDGEPGEPFTIGDGRLFSARASVDNTAALQYPELTIEAVKPGGGSATDWRQVQSGRQFVAQTPEVFTHDADGNLTSDGRWTYEWDAENRLIGMETQPAAMAAGVPKMRLEFAYDARHRRIRKVVKKNWNETASEYTHHEDRRFLYDEGWNLLAEQVVINQMPPEAMTYLWGLDISGTRQGAGGVGGLLSVTRVVNAVPKTYLPCYDGNGNVVWLLSADGSEADTVYEYGPFGETLRATGPMAQSNPFRWSTQFTDEETGLVRYAFRPYSPTIGRWLTRDPLGEAGGENLYAFVRNHPINSIDLLGLLEVQMTLPTVTGPFTYVDEPQNPRVGGRTTFSLLVRCNAENSCKVKCSITARTTSFQINRSSIQYQQGKERGIYGHEQRHIQSVINEAKRMQAELAKKPNSFSTFEAARAAASSYEKPMRERAQEFLNKERSSGFRVVFFTSRAGDRACHRRREYGFDSA